MKPDRRDNIIDKIEARCEIQNTGFKIDNKASPYHLWTGPTSGAGRDGGTADTFLNDKDIQVALRAISAALWPQG